MNRVNVETLCSPDVYPIYFERITKKLKIPVWIAAVSAGAVMGIAFWASNIAAGLPSLEHFPVISAELVSIVLATILVIEVRDRTLAAYRSLLPALDENQQDRFSMLLKSIFDQRRSLIFSAVVGAGGIIHHVSLSYFIWGRIWWYSVVDIILIGFVWWFVVASFFWTCVSVAGTRFMLQGPCNSLLDFSPTEGCAALNRSALFP